jgi:hypothetical protein
MVVGIAFNEPFLHLWPVCVRFSSVDNYWRIDYDDYHDGVEVVSLSCSFDISMPHDILFKPLRYREAINIIDKGNVTRYLIL